MEQRDTEVLLRRTKHKMSKEQRGRQKWNNTTMPVLKPSKRLSKSVFLILLLLFVIKWKEPFSYNNIVATWL